MKNTRKEANKKESDLAFVQIVYTVGFYALNKKSMSDAVPVPAIYINCPQSRKLYVLQQATHVHICINLESSTINLGLNQ